MGRLSFSSPGEDDEGESFLQWASDRGITTTGKLAVRPDSRSGRGVWATGDIAAGEVIASVPRELVIETPVGEGGEEGAWVGRLAAAALGEADADPIVNAAVALRPCVATWRGGGWATNRGEPDPWFGLDAMDNDDFTLLATGSDNDRNIYQKFGLKCHPVVHRATLRLAAMCGTAPGANRELLTARGRAFRACRDDLEKLVTRPRNPSMPGSARDQRVAEEARFWSMCAARAAPIVDDSGEEAGRRRVVICPIFDILDHGDNPSVQLLAAPHETDGEEEEEQEEGQPASPQRPLRLVATRAIPAGEALTRDYGLSAPTVELELPPFADSSHMGEDESQRRLRLLLWAGVKPDLSTQQPPPESSSEEP